MKDGYPEDVDLKRIVELAGGKIGSKDLYATKIGELAGVLVSIWQYDNYIEFKSYIDNDGEPRWKLQLSTAGWSGNETIIAELEQTLFWLMYWQQSKRGGHYWFEGRYE